MSDREDMGALADWLSEQQTFHDGSLARNADSIQTHIERLRQWEKLVRSAARTGLDVACDVCNGTGDFQGGRRTLQIPHCRRCGGTGVAALPAPAGESVTVEELAKFIDPMIVQDIPGLDIEWSRFELQRRKLARDKARALLSTFTITRKSKSEARS